ncbi:lytic transglycosylase domain-containing protein [Magnetococcales bacterium HHB-1]
MGILNLSSFSDDASVSKSQRVQEDLHQKIRQAMSNRAIHPRNDTLAIMDRQIVNLLSQKMREIFHDAEKAWKGSAFSYHNRSARKNLHFYKKSDEDGKFHALTRQVAKTFNLSEQLLRAVVAVGSGFDPKAVSEQGEQGLMQLKPHVAKYYGVKDAFDPEANLMAGAALLKQLLDRYRGEEILALAAYRWGIRNLENNTENLPLETRNFVSEVLNVIED